MKIKLNSSNPRHVDIVKALVEEFPEISLLSKDRKWGSEQPSFKFKDQLYEFKTIDELIHQVNKIMGLKDKDYQKKGKKIAETQPVEEELLLEIPIEKYNLSDLNIKLRLGSHGEKSSTYEAENQTLHYEVEEALEEEIDGLPMEEPEISMTSVNNDIVLDIPAEKFTLHDLKLNIKFTQYGEPMSSYEVKKEEKKEEAVQTEEEPADLSKEVGPFNLEEQQ
jgi:nitrate reductase alpha subunit